jgi:acetyltransferase EpsM
MPYSSDLILIGGGGHAAELYSYLFDLKAAGQDITLLGVIDEGKPAGPWEGSQILGDFQALARLLTLRNAPLHFLTAVGNNAIRRKLVQKAETAGHVLPWTLRHPTTQVGRSVEIGAGSLLAPGSIVTTRTRIGRHCILNIKASVSHDCVVGDYVNINPSATVAGKARIGDGVFVGAGATVIDRVSIGEWTIIGAGAVVVRDLPPHVTAVGVPARIIKHHQPRE